jgi:hypothetical protein
VNRRDFLKTTGAAAFLPFVSYKPVDPIFSPLDQKWWTRRAAEILRVKEGVGNPYMRLAICEKIPFHEVSKGSYHFETKYLRPMLKSAGPCSAVEAFVVKYPNYLLVELSLS